MLMMGNLDSDSGVESFALYSELTKSHKWLDKVGTHMHNAQYAAFQTAGRTRYLPTYTPICK